MIRLEDVSKRYPNGTAALQDVDLSIDQGDFAFLVGSSGAGKSTLIKLLIRDELPTTGRQVRDLLVHARELLRARSRSSAHEAVQSPSPSDARD